MRIIQLPLGPRVLLAASIFELSASRHAEFNHWLVRGAGIGSGPGDIDRHFATVSAFVAAGKTEEAADALALLHYCFGDTLDKLDSTHLAFGVLVVEVDDKLCQDFSEAGLRALIRTLSDFGLTQEMVADEVATIKKQLRRN
jgi:hypothetical protein